MRSRGCSLSALLLISAIVGGPCRAHADANSELPIGYLEITEGDDGLINVEARCAPVATLLGEVVARAGKQLEMPAPIRTYVTIHEPEKWESPAWWLSRIELRAGLKASRSAQELEAAAVYRPVVGWGYDPTLEEDAVLDQYRHPAAEAADAGLEGAVLILQGRYLPPPYEVATNALESGNIEVRVNGVLAWTAKVPPLSTYSDGSYPDGIPASGQFKKWDDLTAYIRHKLYPALLRQRGKEQALQAVREFVETQDIVEKVYPKDHISKRFPGQQDFPGIDVRLRGNGEGRNVFPGNYDYERGKVIRARILGRSSEPESPVEGAAERAAKHAAERAGERAAWWKENLAKPKVIARTSGAGQCELSTLDALEGFREHLRACQDLSLCERECLMHESLSDIRLARSIAANLPEDLGALLPALDTLIARKTAEKSPK